MQWILAVGAIVCFTVANGGTITCDKNYDEEIICGGLNDTTTVTVNHVPRRGVLRIYGTTGIAPNAFDGLNFRMLSIGPSYPDVPLTLKADSFNSLRNLTVLVINDTKFNYTGEPLASLTKLEELYLYGGILNEVPTAFIAPVTELRSLAIVGYPISVIRTNAFATLKKLQRMDLTFNQIKELEPGCFNGLDALTYLDLRYSPITSLDGSLSARSLQGMPNLTVLMATIQNNGTLEPGMFGGNPKLRGIELYGCLIKEIPRNVFNNLSLTNLTFTRSFIEAIEPGAFAGLNVRDMKFDRVDIGKSIKAYTFSDFNVTREFRIYTRDTDLNQIEPRAFSGLRAGGLSISHNNVKVIVAETFSGMHAKYLGLTGMPIANIEPEAFKDAYFEKLYVDDNSTILGHTAEWGIPSNVTIVTLCYNC